MQVPHNLIQRRRKGAIDIQEHAVRVLDLQNPAQVGNDGLELLRGADLANLAAEARRGAHGLEADQNLFLGELAGGGESRGCVPREAREDGGGCHGEGQLRRGRAPVWDGGGGGRGRLGFAGGLRWVFHVVVMAGFRS